MNNNENFKKWIQEVDELDARDINQIIEKTVRSSQKKRRNHLIFYPLSAFVSIFVIFAILLNVSDELYVLAKSNSIIAPIAQLIRFDKSLESAFNDDFYQSIDKSVTVGDMTLEVKYAVRDIYNLVFFVKSKEKGKYLEGNNVGEFGIDLYDSRMNKIEIASGRSSFEKFAMVDISALTSFEDNNYTLRYYPNYYERTKYGDITIQLDPKKSVKILEKIIDKEMFMEGQKVILDKIEIGAFQSRLHYHLDPTNMKYLSEIRFEGEKSAFILEDKIDGEDMILMSFDGGYVKNPHSIEVVMKDCSILDKDFMIVNFDLNTMKFERLPEFVEVVDAHIKNDILSLTLDNKLNFDGTNIRLMSVDNENISFHSTMFEFNYSGYLRSIFEFEIGKSTGLVQFKMTGGRKSCAVPVSIDINY